MCCQECRVQGWTSSTIAHLRLTVPDHAAWKRGTRPTLLSYQVAKTGRTAIGSAAAKCSNQADLHSTFIDPLWPSDLPQRPSLTSMPLATDQKGWEFGIPPTRHRHDGPETLLFFVVPGGKVRDGLAKRFANGVPQT